MLIRYIGKDRRSKLIDKPSIEKLNLSLIPMFAIGTGQYTHSLNYRSATVSSLIQSIYLAHSDHLI